VPLESIRDVNFPLRDSLTLDVGATAPLMDEAIRMWIIHSLELFEDGRRLDSASIAGVRISLPSDRSFVEYSSAVAHVDGPPLPPAIILPWRQAMVDMIIDYPIVSPESRFAMRPGLAHLGVRTVTMLRFLPAGGGERAFQYTGNPGLVELDPSWFQAASRFVHLGFEHILDGIDHLLFVFCLVIPVRRLRPLIAIVTSFTVAHSITLIASALGYAPSALWFPPLIETLIAASIVYMAFENIVGVRIDRRWMVAFAFGLVHGFGFSFALGESLQFAGRQLAAALLTFNLGVELGQIAVLLVVVPAITLLFRHVVAERMGTIVLSAIVAHTAWHWMAERWTELRQYDFQGPVFDATFALGLVRALMLALAIGGVGWALGIAYRRFARVDGAPPPGAAPEP
jgi:hypothetical protein